MKTTSGGHGGLCVGRVAAAFIAAAGLWAGAGCKPAPPTDAVKELGAAFSKRDGDASAEEARRNQELAALAMAAARSNDLQTVGASLQTLRGAKGMSLDQRIAVQDAMNNFQGSLAERADRGDPAARAALDSLRGGHAPR